MSETTKGCVVIALGTIAWDAFSQDVDPRRNEPIQVLYVRDDSGFFHFVTPGMCYRNGTTIESCVLGDLGRLILCGVSAVGFSCPKLFKSAGEPDK